MQKKHYEITHLSNEKLISSYEEIMAAAMAQVEDSVCRYRYLLPRGWRCIIKIKGADRTVAHLDLQSNQGGGSFAEVKMKTLEDWQIAATGCHNLGFIRELINRSPHREAERAQEILKVFSLEELRKIHHEWLRDNFEYTNYYGGINVYYDELSAKLSSADQPERGLIQIAFSGASQEQDTMFAVRVLWSIQEAMVRTLTRSQFWFNLRELEEIPNVKFWLDNFGIEEAVRRF